MVVCHQKSLALSKDHKPCMAARSQFVQGLGDLRVRLVVLGHFRLEGCRVSGSGTVEFSDCKVWG